MRVFGRLLVALLRGMASGVTFFALLFGLLLGLLLQGNTNDSNVEVVRVVPVTTRRDPRFHRESFGILYTLGLHSPIIEVYRARYGGGRGPYLEELLQSVATVRQNSPNTPIALVTDDLDVLNSTTRQLFDKVVFQQDKVFVSWGDVIPAVLATPWQRTLFLDLDVKICSDVNHMFEWLEYYDMGVVLEPYLFSHTKGGLLHSKPQAITWGSLNNWNTGMILYDNNPRVRSLFEAWNNVYNYPGGTGGGDQSWFAEQMQLSDVRIKELPAEYNLRIHTNTLPHFLTGEVRILHSRYETCERVNRVTVPRLYDHLKDRVVYTWELDEEDPEGRPLKSRCVADVTAEARNTRQHNAVVHPQYDVPENIS